MYTEKDLREAFRAGSLQGVDIEINGIYPQAQTEDEYINAAKEKQTENLNKLSEMYNNKKA